MRYSAVAYDSVFPTYRWRSLPHGPTRSNDSATPHLSAILRASLSKTIVRISALQIILPSWDPGPPPAARPLEQTVVVLEGAVDVVMDGTRYTATAGSYVIIPGKAHHAWYVHEAADVVLLARRDGGRLPLRRAVAAAGAEPRATERSGL